MASSLVRREWAEPRRRAEPIGAAGTALIFAVAVAALYFGHDVLMPLALAILLSFVLAPLVLLLRRARIGRVSSVLVAVFLAFLVMCGVAGLIGGQLAQLAENLPQYESTINQKIQSLQAAAAGNGIVERASSMLTDLRKEIRRSSESAARTATSSSEAASTDEQQQKPIPVEIREPPAAPLQVIRSVVGPLWGPLATTGIVIIFLVFILLQREDLRDRFIRLVGAHDLQRTTGALDDGVRRLSRYFLVQSAINASFGVLIGTGLFLIGVPNPVLWGVLAMLLRFVPYIGAWIAAFFPTVLAFAVDPHWSMLLWTIGLFAVIELIMGQVVEPLLNAHSTGLSAVAIVVAAAFWTWLWGPVGLVLSTPLTVCLVVIGRHVEHLQFLDVLLGDQPALAPEESFYQRMLAGDPDEAAHQAEEYLKDKTLSAYYDEIAVRGLALAQLDVNRGVIDHDRRVQIRDAVEELVDDLSDHDDAPPGGTEGEKVDETAAPARPREEAGTQEAAVLCVAGRGSLDEAAAMMLAQLLQKHGMGARVVPSREVSPPNILRLDAGGVKVVCLTYLEPGGFTSARYMVRRVRRRLPRARVVLGLWTQTEAESDRDNAVRQSEADLVVTSLAQAVERIASEVDSGTAAASGAVRPESSVETPSAAG
ncbi:AI-2E family transporter [Reyranella sp.]|jgi:predicted PurR-regulated permease PerM|uniref:AI-2E family transporter n=1 Tax=Reyranella sp. TaxID=1929291 RepID=UPI002F945C51